MQIIPVLDLSKGLVVHAKQGDRNNYLPIDSQLCRSSNPVKILKCFLDLFDFKCIYIADLDALQHQGENIKTIESISRLFPNLIIWLDTGIALIKHYLDFLKIDSLQLILSTESIDTASKYTSLIDNYPSHRFVFSIDYKCGKILGLYDNLQAEVKLPNDVLILNLDNVGSDKGIDIPTILNLQSLSNGHNAFYGGGIRNRNDLIKLKKLGFAGALLSSALHSTKITREDIYAVMQ